MLVKLSRLAVNVSACAVRDLVTEGAKLVLRDTQGSNLVELPLKRGVTLPPPDDGRLLLAAFDDALALQTGDPTRAHLLDAAGEEVLELDVGPKKSDAAIRLDPYRIFAHGLVSVKTILYEQPRVSS